MSNPKRHKRCHMAAMEANQLAQAVLNQLDVGSRPSHDQVLDVLERVEFQFSRSRSNVLREEHTQGVQTAQLGLVWNRGGRFEMAKATLELVDVCRLLCRWVNLDGVDVAMTSITLNKGFNCARHRDKNNEGPSVIRALGQFTGGKLRYWPQDPLKVQVGSLSEADAVDYQLDNRFVLIDGRRAHEVLPFRGTRYSVVFYTAEGYLSADEDVRKLLIGVGFRWPSRASLHALTGRLVEDPVLAIDGTVVPASASACVSVDRLVYPNVPVYEAVPAIPPVSGPIAPYCELSGFAHEFLNGRYVMRSDRVLNGYPSLWLGTTCFMYFAIDKYRICRGKGPTDENNVSLVLEGKLPGWAYMSQSIRQPDHFHEWYEFFQTAWGFERQLTLLNVNASPHPAVWMGMPPTVPQAVSTGAAASPALVRPGMLQPSSMGVSVSAAASAGECSSSSSSDAVAQQQTSAQSSSTVVASAPSSRTMPSVSPPADIHQAQAARSGDQPRAHRADLHIEPPECAGPAPRPSVKPSSAPSSTLVRAAVRPSVKPSVSPISTLAVPSPTSLSQAAVVRPRCHYAGNANLDGCLVYGEYDVVMKSKKSPRHRSVCLPCRRWLVQHRLIVEQESLAVDNDARD